MITCSPGLMANITRHKPVQQIGCDGKIIQTPANQLFATFEAITIISIMPLLGRVQMTPAVDQPRQLSRGREHLAEIRPFLDGEAGRALVGLGSSEVLGR